MDALAKGDGFQFEGFRLDPQARVLFRRDEVGALVPMAIGSRAIDVLGVLVGRAGDLVSRDEFMAAVWPATAVEDANLNIQIAALRRILDRDRAEASCIQTIPGRGYRFAAPVMRLDAGVPTTGSASASTGAPAATADVPPIGFSASAPPNKPPSRKDLRSRQRIIAGVIGALLCVAVGLAGWHLRSSRSDETRQAPRLSIVILPFANLGNDLDQQYFADGITEDLTTDLSRISDMFVISRNTAFTYRNKPIDTKQIGRELGVRYVLEGSVRRSDNKVRVSAQLIDAQTDTHLWADRLDREVSDLLVLQGEITTGLANALGVNLIAAEAARPTEHPDALDYIFRGRTAVLKPHSRSVWAEAISLFERALALDPQSVEAQTRLAGALAQRVLDGMADSAAADLERADRLIDQALAASPRSWYAHATKAQVLRAQGRCQEAIPEYEAALAIDRNAAAVMHFLSDCKLTTGAIDEVIPLEELAIRLAPLDPINGFKYARIGTVHLLQSRTNEATAWLEKARSEQPAFAAVHAWLASAYALSGETDRARAELAEARKLRGEGSWSTIAKVRAGLRVAPTISALAEATFFAGLRKAGLPEE